MKRWGSLPMTETLSVTIPSGRVSLSSLLGELCVPWRLGGDKLWLARFGGPSSVSISMENEKWEMRNGKSSFFPFLEFCREPTL
jgi:hypothetical protein